MICRQKTEERITQDHPRASRKQVFTIEDQEKSAGFPYAVPGAYAVHQGKPETMTLVTMLILGLLDALGWDSCFQTQCRHFRRGVVAEDFSTANKGSHTGIHILNMLH